MIIVIVKSFCAFTEKLTIKWLHTLLGKTQLIMRTDIYVEKLNCLEEKKCVR